MVDGLVVVFKQGDGYFVAMVYDNHYIALIPLHA
jgi:hypothetical protein